MAALGTAALRAPRLLAASCRRGSSHGSGDGGRGQPREPAGSGGRARRGAEPGPIAGSQPAAAEGADTRSYLWARYHEMKKLVYGKRRKHRHKGVVPLNAAPGGVTAPLSSGV